MDSKFFIYSLTLSLSYFTSPKGLQSYRKAEQATLLEGVGLAFDIQMLKFFRNIIVINSFSSFSAGSG